jgi:signal transduction histidine kinase/CHASE3 domain sensor protein
MGHDSALNFPSGWRLLIRGVRGRLLGSYVILVLVLLVGLSAAFSSMQVLRTHFIHTVNTVDALTETVMRIERRLDAQESTARGYLLTGDPSDVGPYVAAEDALPALTTKAAGLLVADRAGSGLLRTLENNEKAWHAWVAPRLQQPVDRERGSANFVNDMLRERALFAAVNQAEGRLTAYLAAERALDLQGSLKAVDTSGGVFFLVLIITGGFVAVVAWFTVRGIMRPLDQLARAATTIGLGNLSAPIEIGGAVEFARLGANMDWMRRQLDTQRVLSEILGSSLQMESVWAAFAAHARDLVPFDQLVISEIDPAGVLLTTLYVAGPTPGQCLEGSRQVIQEHSLSLLQPSQPFLLQSDISLLLAEPRLRDVETSLDLGLRSQALIPLRSNGRMVGSLGLAGAEVGAYSGEVLGPILALAPLIGAALENARLYASLDDSNRALSTVNQELESFSYSVSHDLRAPLRSISGFSEAILEDYAEALDEDGREYLHHVIGSARDMGRLIDDLLHLSRVARFDIDYQDTDLTAIARTVEENLRITHQDHPVTFVVVDGIMVRGNPQLLTIVLQNLLGNAWKFTRGVPAPRVEVGTADREGAVEYFVRDNGAGFDMAYAHKLFGAFQRLHSAREFEGTGIGLATVQRIISRHGGTVRAEGVVGRGATFFFTLGQAQRRP